MNVVSVERAEEFVEAVRREYAAATGIADAQCFVCEPVGWGDGAAGEGGCAVNPLAQQNPHRRFNPLKREWVLVSPNRTQRPWQGQTEKTAAPAVLTYDPDCYLCPGNRAGWRCADGQVHEYLCL